MLTTSSSKNWQKKSSFQAHLYTFGELRPVTSPLHSKPANHRAYTNMKPETSHITMTTLFKPANHMAMQSQKVLWCWSTKAIRTRNYTQGDKRIKNIMHKPKHLLTPRRAVHHFKGKSTHSHTHYRQFEVKKSVHIFKHQLPVTIKIHCGNTNTKQLTTCSAQPKMHKNQLGHVA